MTEDLRLAAKFRDYGTSSAFNPIYHIQGDALEAELVVREFIATYPEEMFFTVIGAAGIERVRHAKIIEDLKVHLSILQRQGRSDEDDGHGEPKHALTRRAGSS